MLKIKKEEELLVNVFNNVSELYNFCKNTPRRRTSKKESDNDDSSFSGTNSLEEAYDLLIKGDEKLFKEINKETKKIDITKILGNAIKRNSNFNDIVGFQPDVPTFLKGVPTSMINTKPNRVSQKILNICYNVSVSCGVSHSQIKKAGIIYAKMLDILEKRGYRCNLYILSATAYNGEYGYCLVKVKTDREPFNLKKMCFMMGNASYDRRVMFKWTESADYDEELTKCGYGRPVTDKERIRKVLDKVLNTNFSIWNVQENYQVTIENVIEQLENQGIKIKEEE